MISISEKALEELKRVKEAQRIPADACLRVGFRNGASNSFVVAFDPNVKPNDYKLQISEINVIVDPKSLPQLAGLELDFNPEPGVTGFVIKKPKPRRAGSGCGASFTV